MNSLLICRIAGEIITTEEFILPLTIHSRVDNKQMILHLYILGLLALMCMNMSYAETFIGTKLNNFMQQCKENFSISTDLMGLNENTDNVSVHCGNSLYNWHIFQFTNTNNGELKNESKFDGSSIGYLYKDYFLGLYDRTSDDWKRRGFMITGAGYGDYTKFDKVTNDPTSFDGIFFSFGGGVEQKFGKKWSAALSLGIATGGVVTDQYINLSIIYNLRQDSH